MVLAELAADVLAPLDADVRTRPSCLQFTDTVKQFVADTQSTTSAETSEPEHLGSDMTRLHLHGGVDDLPRQDDGLVEVIGEQQCGREDRAALGEVLPRPGRQCATA